MSATPLKLVFFPSKVEKVEKVLGEVAEDEKETELFLKKINQKKKLKGTLKRLASIPCCYDWDSYLK
jgi:hypothetical protein